MSDRADSISDDGLAGLQREECSSWCCGRGKGKAGQGLLPTATELPGGPHEEGVSLPRQAVLTSQGQYLIPAQQLPLLPWDLRQITCPLRLQRKGQRTPAHGACEDLNCMCAQVCT